MIRSLKIDNFKALNGVEITLAPFTVLIGNNSAGKTTVLQAIAFLKHCCTSYIDKFLDDRGLTANEVCSKFSNRRTMSFSVKIELNGREIEWYLAFNVEKSRNSITLHSEWVTVDNQVVLQYSGSKKFRLNAVTGEEDSIMEGSYNNSIIKFVDTEKDEGRYPVLVEIKKFFLATEALDLLSPLKMKGSSQGETDVLGLSGEKLSSFIKRLSPKNRDALVRDVQLFMKPFSAVEPKTKQYGWVHLEAQETYGERTIQISSSNISDGILRVIAFCALRHLNNNGGAILLDEIEDGINNENLELLVHILRGIQREKKIQIIATTHNTVLLDFWRNEKNDEQDSIVFLGRDDLGRVAAKPLFSSPALRDKLDYMYPGEIVLNMTNNELSEALTGIEDEEE